MAQRCEREDQLEDIRKYRAKVVLEVGSENGGTSFRRNEAGASGPIEILQENKDTESALVGS